MTLPSTGKTMISLSIIIPFQSLTIVNTLKSLSMCIDKDKCEVILVSDGLDWDELDFLKAHYSNLNIEVIISEKCGRIGHLRNLGIRKARTRFFYFVDSDCWLEKDSVTRIIAEMNDNNVIKGKNVFIGRNWMSKLDAQIRDERYESNPTFAYCPNLMIQYSVFEKLGLFNAQCYYGSDGEFAKRISESKIYVHYDEGIILYHDCTDTITGIFKKWMKLGEARYYRYKNEHVENWFSTYFPNLFNHKRGVFYNSAALLCNIGRAIGMFRGWCRNSNL